MRLHTINLYRVRHSAILLRWICRALSVVVLMLAGYGAYYSMTGYLTADQRARAALEHAAGIERTAFALLNGEAQEVDIGERYILVTRFKRETEIMEITQ